MKNISPEELRQYIVENKDFLLVDVRPEEERLSEGHIPADTHIPLSDIETQNIPALNGAQHKPVICYCRSGNRSMLASLHLEQMGFTDTYNLSGGVVEWFKKD